MRTTCCAFVLLLLVAVRLDAQAVKTGEQPGDTGAWKDCLYDAGGMPFARRVSATFACPDTVAVRIALKSKAENFGPTSVCYYDVDGREYIRTVEHAACPLTVEIPTFAIFYLPATGEQATPSIHHARHFLIGAVPLGLGTLLVASLAVGMAEGVGGSTITGGQIIGISLIAAGIGGAIGVLAGSACHAVNSDCLF